MGGGACLEFYGIKRVNGYFMLRLFYQTTEKPVYGPRHNLHVHKIHYRLPKFTKPRKSNFVSHSLYRTIVWQKRWWELSSRSLMLHILLSGVKVYTQKEKPNETQFDSQKKAFSQFQLFPYCAYRTSPAGQRYTQIPISKPFENPWSVLSCCSTLLVFVQYFPSQEAIFKRRFKRQNCTVVTEQDCRMCDINLRW